MKLFIEGGDVVEVFCECVFGCVVVEDVLIFGINEVFVECNIMFDEKLCDFLEEYLVDEVCVCLVIICDNDFGVCVKCYGCDFVCGYIINLGELVGVIVV